MVNRCICFDTTFAEILRRLEDGQSIDDIVDETGCGSGCSMCQPYIKLTILTNQSEHQPNAVETRKNEIAKVDDPIGW